MSHQKTLEAWLNINLPEMLSGDGLADQASKLTIRIEPAANTNAPGKWILCVHANGWMAPFLFPQDAYSGGGFESEHDARAFAQVMGEHIIRATTKNILLILPD